MCTSWRSESDEPDAQACQGVQLSDQGRHLILQQNRWLAARHGLDALLIDGRTQRKAPARVLARELVDRLIDTGQDLRCVEHLQNLRMRTRTPGGAVTQLATYARTNNVEDVVRLMTRADSSGHRQPSLSPLLSHGSMLDPIEAGL